MSAAFWRRCSFALAALCALFAWRDCTRGSEVLAPTAAAPARDRGATIDTRGFDSDGAARAPATSPAQPRHTADCATGPSFYGFTIPPWATSLAPQRGESLLAYRDRIVPIARTAIAPQRERVAHLRDDFAAAAHLEPSQRAVLDSATTEAADAIEEQVLGAVMNGDFSPQTFRPMAGVELARQLLDDVDRSDQKFRAALTPDQRATLAQQHFDFADYLVFSTPWEQALGYAE